MPFEIVQYATDITDQVLQRESFEMLSLVANGTDNSVVIAGADRKITYVNKGFERLTGYSLADVHGKSPGALLQGRHTINGPSIAFAPDWMRGNPFTKRS